MPITPQLDMLRTPLAKARGLGSAHAGSHSWWAQRLTALALIPLTLWFIFSALQLLGAPRQLAKDWMSTPHCLVLMVLLILSTFYHLQLGLQVVLEDYVHAERLKLSAVIAVKAVCTVLAITCLIAVLKIGL